MSSIKFEVEVPSDNKNSSSNNSIQSFSQENDHKTPTPWTISKLTRNIRFVLEGQFRSLLLEGEISNFKRPGSGHLYFQLKDSHSQIRAIMFRQMANSLKYEITDGLEVVVKGHITVFEPRGDYQIQVSSIEPKGIGSLQLAFDQLKEKLQLEGLFNQEHKQKIPFLPRRIGIVTSSTGAVIHDMMNILKRRCPIVPTLLYPASVQGEKAVPTLIEGIQYLNTVQESQEIDVIIMGRGGGSIEDLWAFNDESLARAIFESKIPIVSGVGHETDFTIADFVSDLRAPTPSAAMELTVPNLQDLENTIEKYNKQLQLRIHYYLQNFQNQTSVFLQRLKSPEFIINQHLQRLDDLSHRLSSHIDFQLNTTQQQITHLAERLLSLNPSNSIHNSQKDLERLLEKLIYLVQHEFNQVKNKFSKQITLLDSLSPLSIMQRGYGIIVDSANGQPIHSVQSVKEGDTLSIHLKDGVLQTNIKKITFHPSD